MPDKQIIITLPHDIAHFLEVRAAIDDQKVEDGIQALLCKLVEIWRAAHENNV